MNAVHAHRFGLGTAAEQGDGLFVLLALADIDNRSTLGNEASLTVLCRWVVYPLIPGCLNLSKALTQIRLKIFLFFISPNY